MKTVFSNSELAHEWAYQSQNEGRTSNESFYFNGNTIYSYGSHFPIASISETNSYDVYFTTRSYSNTTAKHISLVRNAVSHKNLIYCHNPLAASRGLHSGNIQAFENEAKQISQSLPRSKKPEIHLSKIAYQRLLLETYANHFNIDLNALNLSLEYIYIETKEGGTQATESEKLRIAELKVKQAKELKDKAKKEIKLFREFKIRHLQYRNGFDLLRYNSIHKAIETSQGVLIELPIAKELHTQITEIVKTGNCTLCGSKFMERYEIKEISAKQIVIGCHTISSKEISLIASQMNWNV